MNKRSPYSTATPESRYSRAYVLYCFIAIAVVSFLLRIWYAGNLYQDDGLWFITAEEVLRGKALYREIFFDKPPGLPLVYAGLFKVFGAHILTIRLFTIFYSVLVSAVLYRFGSRFYDKRTGLIAAAMFSVFSTTYISGDMQSLNTDFLMAPFYASGAYLLMRSCADFFRAGKSRDRSARLAFAGGCMTGLAFQINPKGVFDLIFFALVLIGARHWRVKDLEASADPIADPAEKLSAAGYIVGASRLFAVTVAGFILSSLPFLLYIAGTHSFSHYKLYVWDLSSSYANYYPLSRTVEMFLRYGTDYFRINNTLSIALVIVAAVTIRRALRYRRARRLSDGSKVQDGREPKLNVEADDSCRGGSPWPPQIESKDGLHAGAATEGRPYRRPEWNEEAQRYVCKSDAMLLIWFAVSFVGVASGGRFFAHYYFQALPSLCLIGARGLVVIFSALEARNRLLRQIAIALLIAGFLYTLGRSHSDTVSLAADWLRGRNGEINREARIVAATVRELPDPAATVDRVGAESIREGGPRTRAPNGPSDYLFVWGNWPEIYYWSGLIPASRYVGVQPLTGLAADLQYGREEYRLLVYASVAAAARTELARDLELTPPKYIVDELGFRDEQLSIQRYPELQEVMKNYERRSLEDKFPIYIRKH